MLNYKNEYYLVLDELFHISQDFYGTKLVSFVVFGSVARDIFRPNSDIDLLIVAEDFLGGRLKRMNEFQDNVGNQIEIKLKELRKSEIFVEYSPIFKTKEEVQFGSPLFFDMIEEAKILFDREDFFRNYLSGLKDRMNLLGSKKVNIQGGYYWDLKPDMKLGEKITL